MVEEQEELLMPEITFGVSSYVDIRTTHGRVNTTTLQDRVKYTITCPSTSIEGIECSITGNSRIAAVVITYIKWNRFLQLSIPNSSKLRMRKLGAIVIEKGHLFLCKLGLLSML